jgi:tetratricopeptide (TPR) repeat protein
MSKRKRITGRKTRSPGRSRRVTGRPRGSRDRWIRWVVGCGAILCATIAALLVVKYMWAPRSTPSRWQRNQPPFLLSQESMGVSATLPPEQQIGMLKSRQMELAEKVLTDFPDSGDAYILMGDLHRRLGSSDKAAEFWQKGLELSPKRADVYHRFGIVAFEKGDFDEAISFWQKALELDRRMPGLHNAMARALMGLGRHDEAIKELQEDLRISPQSADNHFLLGQAFLQQQDYDRAKVHYEKAIELQPDHTNAYYGLSTACARLKQTDKAKQYLAVFRKLRGGGLADRKYGHSPSDDLARTRQSMAGLSMEAARLYQARGQISGAEALLKHAVAVDPNSAAPHKKLAALYRLTNQLPAALAQCERISQLEPNDPTCHLLIGTLALQLKQGDRAEKAFRRLVALSPNQSVGYRELAHLYLRANMRFSEARKLAQKAVELEPTAGNYFVLGLACQKTDDKQAAQLAMRKAVELAPDNRQYRQMYDLIRKSK